MAYIMFMKEHPTTQNMHEVQLGHPVLGTSHSKSIGGGVLETSTHEPGQILGEGTGTPHFIGAGS